MNVLFLRFFLSCTNPNSNEVGMLCKTYIKRECNDLQILSNLNSVEYATKTYSMFKLINFIVFVQIHFHFELDVCNTFQNSWDGANKRLEKLRNA